ncbi:MULTISPECIES: hypothetical protein [unclassified Streptomyces]|uniref:hypothetical protein n=1 Tax=unclassified Streptomyces TaxID=2593676 RepID=UPI0036B737EC
MDRYERQVDWVSAAGAAAAAILLRIPRDLRTTPGFTTKVKFSLDVATGRVILAASDDCRNDAAETRRV